MRIVKAKLVKLKTDDGWVEINEGVELGKEYNIDLDSIKEVTMLHYSGVKHRKLILSTVDNDGFYTGYYPVELLEIEANA